MRIFYQARQWRSEHRVNLPSAKISFDWISFFLSQSFQLNTSAYLFLKSFKHFFLCPIYWKFPLFHSFPLECITTFVSCGNLETSAPDLLYTVATLFKNNCWPDAELVKCFTPSRFKMSMFLFYPIVCVNREKFVCANNLEWRMYFEQISSCCIKIRTHSLR